MTRRTVLLASVLLAGLVLAPSAGAKPPPCRHWCTAIIPVRYGHATWRSRQALTGSGTVVSCFYANGEWLAFGEQIGNHVLQYGQGIVADSWNDAQNYDHAKLLSIDPRLTVNVRYINTLSPGTATC
jgi:hypothetical protein